MLRYFGDGVVDALHYFRFLDCRVKLFDDLGGLEGQPHRHIQKLLDIQHNYSRKTHRANFQDFTEMLKASVINKATSNNSDKHYKFEVGSEVDVVDNLLLGPTIKDILENLIPGLQQIRIVL